MIVVFLEIAMDGGLEIGHRPEDTASDENLTFSTGSRIPITAYGERSRRKVMMRRVVASGSPLEPEIGFSRAVRVGAHIAVAGTAPIPLTGGGGPAQDVYQQTKRCLEIIEQAISDAGGSLQDVTRTRIMLTDIASWRDAARAHGEYFGDIRPVSTFVQVNGFIDPD